MLAENLSDIFQRGLEFDYDCERQLIKEFPKMIEAAQSAELKAALERQLEESKRQHERLDQIFAALNRAPAEETNHSVHSILTEAEKLIKHIEASPLRDAALIIQGNLVHHNKIALYGSLCALAPILKLDVPAQLLEQTLSEEKAADQELTKIAATVNQAAAGFQNTPHGFVII
jgi:ferritin-like metal-binding protein YciE